MQRLNLMGEIQDALAELSLADHILINPARAEQAFTLVLLKRTRVESPVTDKGVAVRYALSELDIGAGRGFRERRQKLFAAYFRLLMKLLRRREAFEQRRGR